MNNPFKITTSTLFESAINDTLDTDPETISKILLYAVVSNHSQLIEQRELLEGINAKLDKLLGGEG